jgi:hypothetical protein
MFKSVSEFCEVSQLDMNTRDVTVMEIFADFIDLHGHLPGRISTNKGL